MDELNLILFDEFKRLDNLCRDIYKKDNSTDNKGGVTLYIDEMDKMYFEAVGVIPDWRSDYKMLKRVRHIRNELAHSPSAFSQSMCTQSDIDFIKGFHKRILNREDPLAAYRYYIQSKKKMQSSSRTNSSNSQVNRSGSARRTSDTAYDASQAGCLGVVSVFALVVLGLIAVVCGIF